MHSVQGKRGGGEREGVLTIGGRGFKWDAQNRRFKLPNKQDFLSRREEKGVFQWQSFCT